MWLEFLCWILLLSVSFFDFKDRSIPLIIFVLLTLFSVAQQLYSTTYWQLFILNTGINLALFIIQLTVVYLWFKYKKKFSRFFNKAFGWGDVWILMIATLYFEPIRFIWFIIAAGISSIIYTLVCQYFKLNKYTLIPFAGIASILIMIYQVALKINLYGI